MGNGVRVTAAQTRLGPLAERPFLILFLGRTVSMTGSAIAPLALAFAVIHLTGSPSDLGLVLAASFVPQVIFLLVGGVWADRLPRHLVMVASDVVGAAAQATAADPAPAGPGAGLAHRRPRGGARHRLGVLRPGLVGRRPADRSTRSAPAGQRAAWALAKRDGHPRGSRRRRSRRSGRPRLGARRRRCDVPARRVHRRLPAPPVRCRPSRRAGRS
jgi:hypothetical protein